MFAKPLARGSVIYYPPQAPTTAEDDSASRRIRTYGCLTLLCRTLTAGSSPGQGRSWIAAPPLAGTFASISATCWGAGPTTVSPRPGTASSTARPRAPLDRAVLRSAFRHDDRGARHLPRAGRGAALPADDLRRYNHRPARRRVSATAGRGERATEWIGSRTPYAVTPAKAGVHRRTAPRPDDGFRLSPE